MLLLSLLTLIAYKFPVGVHLDYRVRVSFDGYLPILRGGQMLADLEMGVDVRGVAPDSDGLETISSEIKTFKLTLNGAATPFGPSNIKSFFPKTTIEATPQGRQIKTDAPNVRMLIHLPGLDVKRFPDITYLPIEFPAAGIEEGKAFNFQKPFGDGPVNYEVTPTHIASDRVSLDIKLSQTSVNFEDANRAPTDEGHAVRKVEATVSGVGTATFDMKRGLITDLQIEANSVGQATDLQTHAVVDRKLKTTLSVKLNMS